MRKRATCSGGWPCASKECAEGGEAAGDLAGDAGGGAGGVEGVGVGPDEAQPVADVGVAQVVEADAEAGGVGEVGVVLAGAGEVGEELDDVADVDDDEEGRPALVGGQRAGVGLGLAAGAHHGVVPAAGAADGGAFARLGLRCRRRAANCSSSCWRPEPCLRLAVTKSVAPIQVDRAGAGRAVRVGNLTGYSNAVAIARGIACGRAGPIDASARRTARIDERLEVGALGGAGLRPPRDEGTRSGPGSSPQPQGSPYRPPFPVTPLALMRENRLARKRLNATCGVAWRGRLSDGAPLPYSAASFQVSRQARGCSPMATVIVRKIRSSGTCQASCGRAWTPRPRTWSRSRSTPVMRRKVAELLALVQEIGAEAERRGLTDEKLNELLDDR